MNAITDSTPNGTHPAAEMIIRGAILSKPLSDSALYAVKLLKDNTDLKRRLEETQQNLLASAHAEQQLAAAQEEIHTLKCQVRTLDMLAEERMYERDDARTNLKEMQRYNGILKGERQREIDRELLRHGDDIEPEERQELLDEKEWLEQGDEVSVATEKAA